MNYTLSDFDYDLPSELIAVTPVEPREAARLIVPAQTDSEFTFADLPKLLNKGDLLVLNNSRVIPARLHAHRPREQQQGTVEFEILLHKPMQNNRVWEVFAKPAKRMKPSQTITFTGGVTAHIISRDGDRAVIEFNLPEDEIFKFFDRVGEMPLPPYIARPNGATTEDIDNYQTVFADENKHGSVAAPTAGLHFSEQLLNELRAKGVNIAYVTLHVGAGTFQTVREEDLSKHNMHSEWAELSAETAAAIAQTKTVGGKVIAVGTTALRTLESAAGAEYCGETDIFITPGYQFKVVDRLITNFHLPKSTLLMLVSAFIGYDETRALYAKAIADKYRFFSYGDGCLLDRK